MPIIKRTAAKRGDTIIEVTLAFAIFSLVAIITVAMMNLGLAASERSLELVTARNELNAQAEALRFVHSSYISELTLPECDSITASGLTAIQAGEKCQQYKDIWDNLTAPGNVMQSASLPAGTPGRYSIEYPLATCQEVYDNSNQLLVANHAFVINTRQLLSSTGTSGYSSSDAVVRATNSDIFQEAPLNARIIYSANTATDGDGDSNSTGQISSLNQYLRIAKVEGIWVVAVAGPDTGGGRPQYYDFYIETCWYGSGNNAPTSLDSIVRLYNPEGA